MREALEKGNHAALLVLLFPLVGLGLLAWAVRATIRYQRFGVSRLELTTRPAAVGRTLAGTVQAPAALMPPEGFRVRLTCVRRITTGSGKNRSTREEIVWQEEQRVTGRQSRTAEGMATSVPVGIPIPPEAQPCDDSNPRDRVIWRLTVSAEVPGVDYESTFEVPVFRTAESNLPRTPEESAVAAAFTASVTEYRQPHDSRILVSRNHRGTEVLFPPARNPGPAMGLTAFLALWLGVIWALWRFDAPALFPIVFGLFAVLLTWGTLSQWLGVSRVVAGDGAVRQDGKKLVAGRGVRDKREAEWVAEVIREGVKKE